MVGAGIEAATWLLWLWAGIAWPAHPEDTIPMWMFGITQLPGILLVFVLLPAAGGIGISETNGLTISYVIASIVQAAVFTLLVYVLFLKPEKR